MEIAYKDQIDQNHSKVCITCNKTFFKKKCLSFKEWDTRKFCSWGCRKPVKHKRTVHEKFNPVIHTKKCLFCHKSIEIKSMYDFKRRKFCSKSCAKLALSKFGKQLLKEKIMEYNKINNKLLKNCNMYTCEVGDKSPFWKGGITGPAWFNSYAHQIEFCEEVRQDPDNNNLLQVKCSESSCRQWFNPTRRQVFSRITALNACSRENRFYCSDECKSNCSIFGQHLYPKNHKPDHSREVQPELRAMVLERDEYECQICGEHENLFCHHFEGIEQNPIESADVDMCITLCKKCHDAAHAEIGCRYVDLKKENICVNY